MSTTTAESIPATVNALEERSKRTSDAKRRRGKPPLYGEPTIRRSVDIPISLYTMLQRHVAEQNFRAGRSVTSGGRVMVDQLYEFFGLKNPSNG